MTGEPSTPAGNSMPFSEWLALMLAEVERKDAEARAAAEERDRRASDEAASNPDHS